MRYVTCIRCVYRSEKSGGEDSDDGYLSADDRKKVEAKKVAPKSNPQSELEPESSEVSGDPFVQVVSEVLNYRPPSIKVLACGAVILVAFNLASPGVRAETCPTFGGPKGALLPTSGYAR